MHAVFCGFKATTVWRDWTAPTFFPIGDGRRSRHRDASGLLWKIDSGVQFVLTAAACLQKGAHAVRAVFLGWAGRNVIKQLPIPYLFKGSQLEVSNSVDPNGWFPFSFPLSTPLEKGYPQLAVVLV